jgi:hypothetical protein
MLKGSNQNAKGKNKLYLGVLIFGEKVDIFDNYGENSRKVEEKLELLHQKKVKSKI